MSMILVWIVICVVAFVAELITPTALVSIWFAVGAIIGALVALVGFPIPVQIVCFVVVSMVSMLTVRPIASRYLRGNITPTNADRFIGEIAWVTKQISKEEWGEVKIKGFLWHAIPVDDVLIEVDAKVKVIAIEGAKLLVRQIS